MDRPSRLTETELPAPARRLCLGVLVAGLVAAVAGVDAVAQPGRMAPDQRERLRRELRQHREEERSRQDRDAGNGSRSGSRNEGAGERGRLSAPEREQLRRQLREARPDDTRGRGRRRD